MKLKPILTVITLSSGLVFSSAMAQTAEVAPRSIQVESDDSESSSSERVNSAEFQANERKRAQLARPLKELPKELDRRYKKK